MKIFVNFLTILRIIVTIFLPFLWNFFGPITLMIFVGVILLTDFFDGLLARKFNVQTLFGSIMDAVADKIFGIAIILMLLKYEKLFIFPLMAELIIALINFTASLLGAVTKSSFLGKIKMWFLGLLIICGMLSIYSQEFTHIPAWFNIFIDNKSNITFAIVFLTLGTEIMVIIDYTRRILRDLKNKDNNLKFNFKEKDKLKEALFDTDFYLKNKNESIKNNLTK